MKIRISREPQICNDRMDLLILLVVMICVFETGKHTVFAQTIGFNPQMNLGFNPYLSPVYGYGLGLPFGANNFSPARYPGLLSLFSGAYSPHLDATGFMGKIHAKAFFKKLATSQLSLYPYGNIKDKINLMKHPQYAFTPYGAGYGYGQHYGAAMVPNNPYKSTYGDYYDSPDVPLKSTAVSGTIKHPPHPPPIDIQYPVPVNNVVSYKPYLKPILKAGALLTTAAILGKKALESSSIPLHPSGMILSGHQY